MYQTNSVYVKLVRDVSDIHDLKSVFMGPLKAVSVWHCAATTGGTTQLLSQLLCRTESQRQCP